MKRKDGDEFYQFDLVEPVRVRVGVSEQRV